MRRSSALIPNKREFLARRLRDVGLVRLLERASRAPVLLVVTYHRIAEPSTSPYYDPVVSASPEVFEQQIRNLRDRFRLLTLDDLLALADAGFPLAEPSALVTFDDGSRDNFDRAFPILKSLGVPATFFIPTGFLQQPRLPWWDHAAYVIKQSRKTSITLDCPSPLSIDLHQGARTDAIAAVIRQYLDGKVTDAPRFRAHLEERAEVNVAEESLGRDLFMTWDQVRELVSSGMSIGSHSHDHPTLARLSEADQLHELAESRRILEAEIGREIRTLAYPFGWPGTYDDVTKRLASEAGYRLAFSSKEGLNRPGAIDAFDLRRLAVGSADSAVLFRARTALHMAFGSSFL